MGWEVGRRFKREGTYIYLWLIHVDVWQKPIQHCNTIILQLKIKRKKKNYPLGSVVLNFSVKMLLRGEALV